MSLIQTSKYGTCARCGSENTPCRKRQKDLVCLHCCRKEDVEKQLSKQKDKRKVQASLSKLAKTDDNRELVTKEQSKSELLKLADKLVGDFVKKRDSDKDGNVYCPCCYKTYNLEDKNKDGKIIQPLHFIDRGVYNLRFDVDRNLVAGCSYCNYDMWLNKRGTAWINYRMFLVTKLGEREVAEMEIEHRKINKIEVVQLKTVIELYS